MIFTKLSNIIKNPKRSFYVLVLKVNKSHPELISDKMCLKAYFYLRFGYELNLKNPITYSEKLQWLKLYDHRPEYTKMVDKYLAKEYVADVIGKEYVIPTLGLWDKAEDIDWDSLPNQFVLKCTHDSGDLVICKDKSTLDKENAIKKLNNGLKHDYYRVWREWPYKDVQRKIIAEQYMEDSQYHELRDYKFFCFSGEVKAMFIATERQHREEPYFNFFDRDYKPLNIVQGHPQAPVFPQKPVNYELMINLAEKLSKDLPQVRVDFYEVNGQVYFGELTFFHFSGLVPFEPKEWDKTFGDMIALPSEWGG